MQRQVDMEKSMLMAHRNFVANLEKSIELLENDIKEAQEMSSICTDEWCRATEGFIDEIHKAVYSISEPRWTTKEDSERIRSLRNRVKDLYLNFSKAKAVAAA